METAQIIQALTALGQSLRLGGPGPERAMDRAGAQNRWFTRPNLELALRAAADNYLSEEKLRTWAAGYSLNGPVHVRTVGVVAAGNIPLVSLHDLLAVLITGHRLQVKLSDKDNVLPAYLLDTLLELEPALADRISRVDRLSGFDAVIATGSDNTGRYFDYYFGKVPHIIRRNRHSVAVLTGTESPEELLGLAGDVFSYFGLGCRNVSHLFVPEGYDFTPMLRAFGSYAHVADHHLYRNNLDYNRTLLLMNKTGYLDIDFINIVEDGSLASPIANLHYSFYTDTPEVAGRLEAERDKVQCVAGSLPGWSAVPFGKTQEPGLTDYADNADTVQFLLGLD